MEKKKPRYDGTLRWHRQRVFASTKPYLVPGQPEPHRETLSQRGKNFSKESRPIKHIKDGKHHLSSGKHESNYNFSNPLG